MAELADAPDLESGGATRGGSSPLLPSGYFLRPFLNFFNAAWITCNASLRGRT